jgi:hypothetical protein
MDDISTLRQFYASPLGFHTAKLLEQSVLSLCPPQSNLRVYGYGYAVPLLNAYRKQSNVLAIMPGTQGAVRWPEDTLPRVTLITENRWPLADASADIVIMLHALEQAGHERAILREAWRVLSPQGKLLVIAANRHSIWTRLERTPFGHGRSYTKRQLRRLLKDCQFNPRQSGGALVLPPFSAQGLQRVAAQCDAALTGIFCGIAGAIVMEANKDIYAITPVGGKTVPTVMRPVVNTVPVVGRSYSIAGCTIIKYTCNQRTAQRTAAEWPNKNNL